jgi:hypothetical protein
MSSHSVTENKYQRQWVSKATCDFTEENYHPSNIIGPPTVFPQYKLADNVFMKPNFPVTLELEFPNPMLVRGISIYETHDPGSIVSISLFNPNLKTKEKVGDWEYVYTNETSVILNDVRILEPNLQGLDLNFTTKLLKLELACDPVFRSQIDAVQLVGIIFDQQPNDKRNSIAKSYQFDMERLFQQRQQRLDAVVIYQDLTTNKMKECTVHLPLIKHRCNILYEKICSTNNRYIEEQYASDIMDIVLKYIYTDRVIIPDTATEEVVSSSDLKFFDALKCAAIEYDLSTLIDFCKKLELYMQIAAWREACPHIEMTLGYTLDDDLLALLHDRDTCDIEFTVAVSEEEGSEINTIFAHSFILKNRSKYFDAMLSRWKREETIFLEDVVYHTLISMLEFIYSGTTLVTDQNAVELLVASKILLFDDFNLSSDRVIKGITPQNVIQISHIAHTFSLDELFEKCMKCLFTYASTIRDKNVIAMLKETYDYQDIDLQRRLLVSSWAAKKIFEKK